MYGEWKHLNEHELTGTAINTIIIRGDGESIQEPNHKKRKIMHPLDTIRKINRQAYAKYFVSLGLEKVYIDAMDIMRLSVSEVKEKAKGRRELHEHILETYQDFANEPPHRGLTIVPAGEVNLTEDRAELTLAHSKPEPTKVYGGGLHDYRHYEGKENWDD